MRKGFLEIYFFGNFETINCALKYLKMLNIPLHIYFSKCYSVAHQIFCNEYFIARGRHRTGDFPFLYFVP